MESLSTREKNVDDLLKKIIFSEMFCVETVWLSWELKQWMDNVSKIKYPNISNIVNIYLKNYSELQIQYTKIQTLISEWKLTLNPKLEAAFNEIYEWLFDKKRYLRYILNEMTWFLKINWKITTNELFWEIEQHFDSVPYFTWTLEYGFLIENYEHIKSDDLFSIIEKNKDIVARRASQQLFLVRFWLEEKVEFDSLKLDWEKDKQLLADFLEEFDSSSLDLSTNISWVTKKNKSAYIRDFTRYSLLEALWDPLRELDSKCCDKYFDIKVKKDRFNINWVIGDLRAQLLEINSQIESSTDWYFSSEMATKKNNIYGLFQEIESLTKIVSKDVDFLSWVSKKYFGYVKNLIWNPELDSQSMEKLISLLWELFKELSSFDKRFQDIFWQNIFDKLTYLKSVYEEYKKKILINNILENFKNHQHIRWYIWILEYESSFGKDINISAIYNMINPKSIVWFSIEQMFKKLFNNDDINADYKLLVELKDVLSKGEFNNLSYMKNIISQINYLWRYFWDNPLIMDPKWNIDDSDNENPLLKIQIQKWIKSTVSMIKYSLEFDPCAIDRLKYLKRYQFIKVNFGWFIDLIELLYSEKVDSEWAIWFCIKVDDYLKNYKWEILVKKLISDYINTKWESILQEIFEQFSVINVWINEEKNIGKVYDLIEQLKMFLSTDAWKNILSRDFWLDVWFFMKWVLELINKWDIENPLFAKMIRALLEKKTIQNLIDDEAFFTSFINYFFKDASKRSDIKKLIISFKQYWMTDAVSSILINILQDNK